MSSVSRLLTPPQWRIIVLLQFGEAFDGLGERDATPPVQKVEIDVVDAERVQARLARAHGAFPRCVMGKHLVDQKHFTARPAIVSPTKASAAPSPYISAVSMTVIPQVDPESDRGDLLSPPPRTFGKMPCPLAEGGHLLAGMQRYRPNWVHSPPAFSDARLNHTTAQPD